MLVDLWHAETLLLIAAIFVLAGFVKGVVGLGLPTVSLGLLTATLGLKEAMALMLIPSFATNVWQGAVGGYFTAAMRRLWTLLVAVCVGTWAGAGPVGAFRPGGVVGCAGAACLHLCGHWSGDAENAVTGKEPRGGCRP